MCTLNKVILNGSLTEIECVSRDIENGVAIWRIAETSPKKTTKKFKQTKRRKWKKPCFTLMNYGKCSDEYCRFSHNICKHHQSFSENHPGVGKCNFIHMKDCPYDDVDGEHDRRYCMFRHKNANAEKEERYEDETEESTIDDKYCPLDIKGTHHDRSICEHEHDPEYVPCKNYENGHCEEGWTCSLMHTVCKNQADCDKTCGYCHMTATKEPQTDQTKN